MGGRAGGIVRTGACSCDADALAASVGQTTTVTAENMPWACRGPDEVQTMLREARERFPGLTFEPSTRHVGFGLVIEEARVRDVAAEAEAALGAEVDDAARAAEEEVRAEIHPMWDEPLAGRSSELVLWNEAVQFDLPLPPVPLNMPWPVNDGCNFVGCHVQCNMSGLMT